MDTDSIPPLRQTVVQHLEDLLDEGQVAPREQARLGRPHDTTRSTWLTTRTSGEAAEMLSRLRRRNKDPARATWAVAAQLAATHEELSRIADTLESIATPSQG